MDAIPPQYLQSIFENYKDLFSKLIEIKEFDGDVEGIKSLKNDPDLDLKNFE